MAPARGGFLPGDVGPAARAVDYMAAKLGVRETSPNRGPWIDECHRFVGLEPDPKKNPKAPARGYAWCCSSAVWCLHQAGETWAPKTARVKDFWDRCPADRKITEPEVGDIFIHLNEDDTGHMGFVTGKTPERIRSVDGNTNAEGSREGNAVGNQNRLRGPYFKGFVRVGPPR